MADPQALKRIAHLEAVSTSLGNAAPVIADSARAELRLLASSQELQLPLSARDDRCKRCQASAVYQKTRVRRPKRNKKAGVKLWAICDFCGYEWVKEGDVLEQEPIARIAQPIKEPGAATESEKTVQTPTASADKPVPKTKSSTAKRKKTKGGLQSLLNDAKKSKSSSNPTSALNDLFHQI